MNPLSQLVLGDLSTHEKYARMLLSASMHNIAVLSTEQKYALRLIEDWQCWRGLA